MNRRLRRTSAAILIAMAVLAGGPNAARAEEYSCTGSVGSVTYDNIRVPQDATCILTDTRAEGTIYVEENATLTARGVTVIGNVQAENARQVEVMADAQVGGSIQIVQGGGARIESVRINGDLYFDANARLLVAAQNRIGGNLQAFNNRGGLTIADNTIDGNLQCKENLPAPTGGRNRVEGSAEDQCATLEGSPNPPLLPTPIPPPIPTPDPRFRVYLPAIGR